MSNFRALAILKSGGEALLTLGESAFQVSTNYHDAFEDVLAPAVQKDVIKIELQQWVGTERHGSWRTTGSLRIPTFA